MWDDPDAMALIGRRIVCQGAKDFFGKAMTSPD